MSEKILDSKFILDYITFLDNHSASILTIVTVILVIVTLYYAISTKKILNEMVTARKMSQIPLLKILLGSELTNSQNILLSQDKINLHNKGNAPALDIKVSINFRIESESVANGSKSLGMIGIENITIGMRDIVPDAPSTDDLFLKDIQNIGTTKKNQNQASKKGALEIKATYTNVYKKPLVSIKSYKRDMNVPSLWTCTKEEYQFNDGKA